MFVFKKYDRQNHVWSFMTKYEISPKYLWFLCKFTNLRVEVVAVSRNRYGVEKTVDTHTILINAIKFYVCLQEIW